MEKLKWCEIGIRMTLKLLQTNVYWTLAANDWIKTTTQDKVQN